MRASGAALVAVLLVAVVLRAVAVLDAFWFDEIWNLRWIRFPEMDSWHAIFWKEKFCHDNNHQLVTLWMYLLGAERTDWVLYRLPSLVAGLTTIVVLAWGRDWRAPVFAGGMLALSYPMVVYSTEARGYALALLCGVVVYRLLERSEQDGFRMGAAATVAYWACVVFGFASHLVFLHAFGAAGLWTLIGVLRRRRNRTGLLRLLQIHLVPVVWFAALALLWIRDLKPGGAPGQPIGWLVCDVCAWLSGTPAVLLLSLAGAAVLVGFAAFEAREAHREGSDRWVFLLGVALLVPLPPLAVAEEGILYPRYFLLGMAFVLLFAGRALARLHRGGGHGRVVALAVLALFAAGNLWRTVRFLEHGRGGYLECVEYMAANSPAQFVVGSNIEFRTHGTLLGFYKRFLPPGQQVAFLPNALEHPRGVHWWILEHPWYPEYGGAPPDVPEEVEGAGGARYRRVAEFPHFAPSGFTWVLYRRVT